MELGSTLVAFRRKQIGSPVFIGIMVLLGLGTLVIEPWAFLLVAIAGGAWVGTLIAVNSFATKRTGAALRFRAT